MNTRRRRTGSESNPLNHNSEITGFTGAPGDSVINNSVKVADAATPSWVTTSSNVSESYHKKTDSYYPPNQNNSAHHPQFKPLQGFGEGITNYITSNFLPQNTTNSFANHQNHGNVHNTSESPVPLDSESIFADIMTSRDRSQEFAGILRSQQNVRLNNGSNMGAATENQRDLTQYSAFMRSARLIGRSISSTYAKLEKLTLMAKKRSLFDDRSDAEVQDLTSIIRHDLTALTKQLDQLRLATNPSNSTQHMQKHSVNLLGSLQTKVAGITQKFRDVLEVRTEVLKRASERRSILAGEASSGLHHSASSSVLLADEAKAQAKTHKRTHSAEIILEMDEFHHHQQPEDQQQMTVVRQQDTYMESRAEAMKTIESTIVELGTMFTQLATMVKEQDEMVLRIDANVEDAEMNVEGAHSELLKHFKSISSNRWLMVKVFGIVMMFFVIFVVFMA